MPPKSRVARWENGLLGNALRLKISVYHYYVFIYLFKDWWGTKCVIVKKFFCYFGEANFKTGKNAKSLLTVGIIGD